MEGRFPTLARYEKKNHLAHFFYRAIFSFAGAKSARAPFTVGNGQRAFMTRGSVLVGIRLMKGVGGTSIRFVFGFAMCELTPGPTKLE